MARGRYESRPLTDEDMSSWFAAAERQDGYQPPRGREAVRRHLTKRNAVRFWRLKRDYKWLRKELAKIGINPEDAGRYL